MNSYYQSRSVAHVYQHHEVIQYTISMDLVHLAICFRHFDYLRNQGACEGRTRFHETCDYRIGSAVDYSFGNCFPYFVFISRKKDALSGHPFFRLILSVIRHSPQASGLRIPSRTSCNTLWTSACPSRRPYRRAASCFSVRTCARRDQQ